MSHGAVAPEPAGLDPQSGTTIGLVGRANSGKTSIVMHLSGAPRRPMNFPGSSVECVECRVRWDGRDLNLVDLPGIAALSTVTRDEEEAVGFLRGQSEVGRPDVLCVVLDAAKLSVELHLLNDLRELDLPIVVALNKVDVARRAGSHVEAERLAAELGLPVVETDALRGRGLKELRRALLDARASDRIGAFNPEDVARAVSRPVEGAPRRNWTDTLDALLLHRLLGLPLLAFIVFGTFQLVFTIADPFMGWIEMGQEWAGELVGGWLGDGWFSAFVVDGLINGVGSVLIFLPQIALLIAIVTVLEASGYMARAAYLLDRVLGRVGLSGRSFVPLANSFGCAIPGILATRIIDDERDRLATILVAPLMSCSARLPVYVVLIGAFFSPVMAGVVLFALYLVGILTAACVALVLRRTKLRGGQSMLVMELPVYQRPALRVVVRSVTAACWSFVMLAGTVIFATAVIVWALSYFPRPDSLGAEFETQRVAVIETADPERRESLLAEIDAAEARAYFEQSFLARTGKAIQPVFAPCGFDWRTTVGVLAAFPARELVVPTLGILYSAPDVDPGAHDIASIDAPPDDGLRERLRSATDDRGRPTMNALVALAIMVFFALCSQCMATLGVIRRETRSWKWACFAFGYMTGLAWVGATLVYQVGSLLGFGL